MQNTRPEPELNGVFVSDTSIKHPVFITMVMLLVVVLGLLSYTTLPVNLYPDFSIPIIAVSVRYPGASPESVADQVAEPIENELATISGIRNITSTSNEGLLVVVVEFATDVNIDNADRDVREKVNAILPRLPREVEDPIFQKFDPNQFPILSLAITSDGTLSPLELRTLVDDDIVPRLQRIRGVGSVDVTGGLERQINVFMDLDRIKARQILPAQIVHAIRTANTNLGLGNINAGAQDINLRVPSLLRTPEAITRVRITGTPYRIGDVATVEDGVADVTSYARLNGKDAINIDLRKQTDANTVTVADAVKSELAAIFADRSDIHYFIALDDSEFVMSSTRSAIEELIVATMAAILVVFLFFGDLRNTLVTAQGLPIILIGTFAAMQLFGLSINIITLLALSLSVGLVVDDAIVVRENIFRHVEHGETPRVAASRGTAEVALSVVAMTLTVVAVFVPVTFTSGIAGIVFKSFGITIASAITISMVEAFTLAPMTSAYLFQPKPRAHKKQRQAVSDPPQQPDLPDEAYEELNWMARGYGRVLVWSLGHRLLIVGLVALIAVASVIVASGLKFSFFPQQDTGEFGLGFEMPPGTPLDTTDELARQAEAILISDPAVASVQVTVGGTGTPEIASFFVRLHPGESTRPNVDRFRDKLDFLPRLAFSQPDFEGNNTGVTGRQIQLSLQTTRPLHELEPLLLQLQSEATGVPGLVDIDTTYSPGKPELQFLLDPTKAGDLGFTNDDIATSVRTLIEGERATTFRQGGTETDIVVRLHPGNRANIESIRSISLPTATGNVPIGSLVDVEFRAGPTTIRRYNQLNQVLIGANVVDRNINDVIAELRMRLEQLELPPNVFVSFVGQAQDQAEGFETLFMAMGLSVLFVYMVLASQFGSFTQPLVIMLAMPFSFIGSFLALRFVGLDMDITGMIGLIMLLGLVVKNSILLVDFTNRLRESGMEKHAALERAGAVRLRPILMTALSLIAGSMPVAIGLGQGSEIRRGLSIVVIGGMVTSTLLTLLVVPTAYSLMEGLTARIGQVFRRAFAARPAPIAHGESLGISLYSGTPADHDNGHTPDQPARKLTRRPSTSQQRKRRTRNML